MKKTLSMLLAFVILFSLCACSNGDRQTPAPSNPSQNTTEGTEKPSDGTEGTTGTTQAPTDEPTTAPTDGPTTAPTDEPTTPPTQAPTETPTTPPTIQPTTCSHSWKDATCTAPKTCSKCGNTEGSAAGHSWNSATCITPKTCTTCGATEGSAVGHSWNAATCIVPKTCKNCGATEGNAAGHSWNAATCTVPKTCKNCGTTEGSAAGHNYNMITTAPTCTEQGYTTFTCSCGDSYISNYKNPSHNYANYICTACGEISANYRAYQEEYYQLTVEYNAKVFELQDKIDKSNQNIQTSQKAIDNARSTLYSLSPTCPQWFLQQYVNNWQAYGNTYAATQAAKAAWTQQYNSQKAQCENTISVNTTKIQAEQMNITAYQNSITILTTQYNNNVSALKVRYGIS